MRTRIVALSLVLFGLWACGNGAPSAPPDAATVDSAGGGFVVGVDAGAADAPVPADAGGPCFLSGTVTVAATGAYVPGAIVQLGSVANALTDENGAFTIAALWPATATLTVTAQGFPPQSVAVDLSTDAGVCQAAVAIALETSRPILSSADAGVPDWMAFAPDGGPLYATDDVSFWRLPLDGGAPQALATGVDDIVPLGFSTTGDPIFLDQCRYTAINAHRGADCTLVFGRGSGAATVPIQYVAQAPALVGDTVFFQSGVTPNPDGGFWGSWSYVAPGKNPVDFGDQFVMDPAPVAGRDGWFGYFDDALPNRVDYLPTGVGPDGQSLLPFSAVQAAPAAIGVSPDGATVAYETGETRYDPQHSSVALFSGRDAGVLPGQPDSQLAGLTGLVPVSRDSAVELFDGGAAVLEDADGGTPLTASQAFVLADGSLLLYAPGTLTHWPDGASVPFDDGWTQPVLAPGGGRVAFPGTPAVLEVAGFRLDALEETPASVSFSADGASMLVVATDQSLHVVTFPDGGPADTPLEGSATVALFTPDGTAVVYAGSDALGAPGVFLQPIPPAP